MIICIFDVVNDIKARDMFIDMWHVCVENEQRHGHGRFYNFITKWFISCDVHYHLILVCFDIIWTSGSSWLERILLADISASREWTYRSFQDVLAACHEE